MSYDRRRLVRRSRAASGRLILITTAADALIEQGSCAGRTDVTRTGIGIAVRKGAPTRDVWTPETLEESAARTPSRSADQPNGGGMTGAPGHSE